MVIIDYEAGGEHVPFPRFLSEPHNNLTASLAFYRWSITALSGGVRGSLRMAPTSHSHCGFNLAEWAETGLHGSLSPFLFVSHKMKEGGVGGGGGVYSLAHQAGPGLPGLLLILCGPESGGEGGGFEKRRGGLPGTLLKSQCLGLSALNEDAGSGVLTGAPGRDSPLGPCGPGGPIAPGRPGSPRMPMGP